MNTFIKTIGLLFFCIGLWASPVLAQTPVIEGISKNSLNVIRHVNRLDEPTLSLASAQKIKRAVLANTVLDDGERQMLEYLQTDQNFTIKLPTGQVSFSKPVSPDAKAFLETIQSVKYDDPIKEMWARGTKADLSKIIALYNVSSSGKKQITAILAADLTAAWATPGEYSRRGKGL